MQHGKLIPPQRFVAGKVEAARYAARGCAVSRISQLEHVGQVQVGERPPDWEYAKQHPRVDADIDLSLTCENASLESSWPHMPIKAMTALGLDPAKRLNGITGLVS
jgi:hypothetical protein